MKRVGFLVLFCVLLSIPLSAQRKMETLDRGLVAVKVSDGVFLSWRMYGTEWYDVTYNVYRDGSKVNDEPLTVSNYTDALGSLTSSYTVAAIVNGEVQEQSVACAPLSNQYLEIPMVSRPSGYEVNDATAADLDGDGEYEIIVKRMIGDWSAEATQFAYFEAYKMDGTLMWELNVGPNIMSSSGVEINIAAFDLDEDGKAEVFLRTSEGTIFGDGTQIGDTDGDGKTNYRYSVYQSANMQYMNAGPEFLSLVDGETGAELDRVDFIPRGSSSDWGDDYGHRANKFFFGAPYLDGVKPSLFIGRGIYTKTVMRTYDVVDKKLVYRWQFSTDNNPTYYGQGNHNYTIADVDQDGRDEIVWGSMTVDDNGKGLYSTELGHGDALHVGDLDPFRKGTEIFKCLEESPEYGTVFYDGATGEILIHHLTTSDCGRCIAGNFSENIKGAELMGGGKAYSATTLSEVSASWPSENFRIYWDGDLLEEFLDHSGTYDSPGEIEKYGKGSIFVADNTLSCNYTKGTPTLQADLFGDWREEVIWRKSDNSTIRIYTTVDPTVYRNYTLMHDHQYRQAVCWQMCGYNQPPHVSYFLGKSEGFILPPPPTISNGRLVYGGTGNWDTSSSVFSKDDASATFADGDHVLFDVSAGEDVSLSLSETVEPSILTVNSPGAYTLDASAGKLSGDMKLVKQGLGTFNLNGTHDYTGKTEIWTGRIAFNGTLSGSPVWMNVFGEMEAEGELQKGLIMRYGSQLYVGGEGALGNLEVSDSLYMKEEATLVFDVQSTNGSENDTLTIAGDLILEDGSTIQVNPILGDGESSLAPGRYILAVVSGDITCDLDEIAVAGILGTPASLSIDEDSLVMTIKDMRSASAVYWDGAISNVWDLVSTANFLNDGTQDVFVTGDEIVLDDNATSKTVVISEEVSPTSVTFNNTEDYVLQGSGSISGTASLTKNGSGKLTISNSNSFTGKLTVNDGTIQVASLPNELSDDSPIGPVSSNADLMELNGGTLSVTGATTMDRAMYVGENGGTINLGGAVTWNERVTGGNLTKTGNGELIIAGANVNNNLIVKSGKVRLLTEEANPALTVTLNNAILTCYDNSYTYSTAAYTVNVPEGSTAAMYLDGRCYYTGKLTGAGTLNLYIPYVRTDFKGNWSNFTGTIKINSTSGGDVPCRFDNTSGYANAIINMGSNVSAEHLSGSTVKIGTLIGSGYMGNATWVVGARNEDFTYRGVFSGGKLTKVGTGTMTLMGASTTSGITTVSEGTLIASNMSGSATGTGSVYIKDGAYLGGTGTVNGAVYVQNGGTLYAGKPGLLGSSFTVKNVMMSAEAKFHVKVSAAASYGDKLVATNSFVANGELVMENGSTAEYTAGKSYTIVSASTISGAFTSVSPATPGDGLAWDLSEFTTSGVVKVVTSTGLSTPTYETLNVYPNPTSGEVFISIPGGVENASVEVLDLYGKLLYRTSGLSTDQVQLNLSGYQSGVYMIRTYFDDKTAINKIVVR